MDTLLEQLILATTIRSVTDFIEDLQEDRQIKWVRLFWNDGFHVVTKRRCEPVCDDVRLGG